MSAAITSPMPTELKARLYAWLLLLLAVLAAAILLWMVVIFCFGLANLLLEMTLGFGADETWSGLFMAVTGAGCVLLGAFTYFCLVRGTLRDG